MRHLQSFAFKKKINANIMFEFHVLRHNYCDKRRTSRYTTKFFLVSKIIFSTSWLSTKCNARYQKIQLSQKGLKQNTVNNLVLSKKIMRETLKFRINTRKINRITHKSLRNWWPFNASVLSSISGKKSENYEYSR